jgi:ribose transport system ATP-binding protein
MTDVDTGRPILSMAGIVKEFPGVRALDGVDLEVVPGEVHCLLGQNGAGKSTLIKVLAGAHQPDEGTITWQGEQVRLSTPMAAMRLGIATIYQELDLVDGLSVAENIYLGHEQSNAGFTRRGHQNAEARRLLGRLGHAEIPATREVGRLSAAGKQIVSMARALSHDARLIVMDEPSAVLAHDEVDNLFRVIRDLTASGVAVVYISHRLEEIRTVGDRVTVLKDGRTVATGLPARTTPTRDVVSLMTGRTIEYAFPPRPETTVEGDELLRVENLALAGSFRDVSFRVRAGEIVGLAGLVGAGRSEVLETVYGARRRTSGTVTLDGKNLPAGNVSAAVRAGLGLAPEERKSQALLLGEPLVRNICRGSPGSDG